MIIFSCVGLLFVFSATYKIDIPYSLFFKKQALGIASGFVIYFIFSCIDYRTLERIGYFLYFAVIIILIITLIKGSIGLGGRRWIDLKLFKFQPSELAKLFFPPFFTYYIQSEKDSWKLEFKDYMPLLGMLLFSFLLIAKQPDLGTALIITFTGFTMLWLARIDWKFFLSLILILSISSPILWKCLRPYQKKRIEVFFGAGDSRKERYQIEQSKIAIGSGGLVGKGFLKGTQNKLMFLPEGRTDFIFSVLCEETGFTGALAIIILYFLMFFRFFYVISTMKGFFVQLLATGLVMHIIFATIINISMVIGMLPIVGIPLPFMSYGVSHLWITFATLGFFNSIAMRRFY